MRCEASNRVRNLRRVEVGCPIVNKCLLTTRLRPMLLRRGFELDRAAEGFRCGYGDVFVAEERFEGVVEAGVLAFVGFGGIVDVTAVADHALTVDDEDVR